MIIKRLKLKKMNELSKEPQGNEANTLLANVHTATIPLKLFAAIQNLIHKYKAEIVTYSGAGEDWVDITLRYNDINELIKLNDEAKAYKVSETRAGYY